MNRNTGKFLSFIGTEFIDAMIKNLLEEPTRIDNKGHEVIDAEFKVVEVKDADKRE